MSYTTLLLLKKNMKNTSMNDTIALGDMFLH